MDQSTPPRYVVENQRTGETTAFDGGDWLEEREQAIELAVKQKSDSPAEEDFRGIKFYLEYSQDASGVVALRHEILTGERMPSLMILTALHREQEILTHCGKEFEIMKGEIDGETYLAVSQCYATLYYFTVTSPT